MPQLLPVIALEVAPDMLHSYIPTAFPRKDLSAEAAVALPGQSA
jgi:hypothetical protein